MKQILTLVLVLATLGLSAQKVDTTKLIINGGYGYQYKIWKVDSALIVPGSRDTSAKASRQIRVIDTTLWFTGKDGIWRSVHPKASTGGGGTLTTVTGTYPIVITGNPNISPNVTVDTGRGTTNIITGGDLIKVRDSLAIILNSKGTGTVTSVATNNGTGITGGTITTTGTLAIDTAGIISTKANVTNATNGLQSQITANTNAIGVEVGRLTTDSTILRNLINAKGNGTVTSVAKGFGIVQDGTITTSGTITADSLVLSTKAYRQKGIDSLTALIATKQPAGSYLTANQPITVTATGDATGTSSSSPTAPSLPLTLATVNSNVGTFGSSTQVPVITFDAKGRATAVTTATISAGTTQTTSYETYTVTGTQTTATFASISATNSDYAIYRNEAFIPPSFYTRTSSTQITFVSNIAAGDIITKHNIK